jgi:23S rRNA (cytosine1962-C5)-methyltransferase
LSRFVQRQEADLYGLLDGQLLLVKQLLNGVRFLENGLYFEADVVQGQKTGFFLDQRDNRARVDKLAGGRCVLNVFAYTGGVSLYAARGGAAEVGSLDISQPALANAMRNFKLNRAHEAVAAAEHELLVGDAFLTMKQLIANRRRFEMVIIDPPAFAKRKEEVERAVTAYGRLVRLGLHLLKPGGVLVMSSCSSRVSADEFFELVNKTAAGVGRPLLSPDYDLMPLDAVAAFVERERHLPNVPSEAEIRAAGGVNLSRFQMRLLEKIEELTLYTLAQQRAIEALESRLEAALEERRE